MTDYTDLAANTIGARIHPDVEAKLASWFENPEEAYELEAVREAHKHAR